MKKILALYKNTTALFLICGFFLLFFTLKRLVKFDILAIPDHPKSYLIKGMNADLSFLFSALLLFILLILLAYRYKRDFFVTQQLIFCFYFTLSSCIPGLQAFFVSDFLTEDPVNLISNDSLRETFSINLILSVFWLITIYLHYRYFKRKANGGVNMHPISGLGSSKSSLSN